VDVVLPKLQMPKKDKVIPILPTPKVSPRMHMFNSTGSMDPQAV